MRGGAEPFAWGKRRIDRARIVRMPTFWKFAVACESTYRPT
jgi:hypothetical protein